LLIEEKISQWQPETGVNLEEFFKIMFLTPIVIPFLRKLNQDFQSYRQRLFFIISSNNVSTSKTENKTLFLRFMNEVNRKY
jgi:hypothetical protein